MGFEVGVPAFAFLSFPVVVFWASDFLSGRVNFDITTSQIPRADTTPFRHILIDTYYSCDFGDKYRAFNWERPCPHVPFQYCPGSGAASTSSRADTPLRVHALIRPQWIHTLLQFPQQLLLLMEIPAELRHTLWTFDGTQ